ncbi:MAG: carboxypeptidase-like regulatory domain-containing protein [Bacteroidetes bacterium]|nr:carboxypeptidase-like regulatory domain-containing protein [Bacteroidota bacterium]MBP8754487.1 carboxypeptidase-like regulatory domain-containing protein [Chitinophagales bacterium]MBP9190097.1 carboxypeptidase-like regulatory domain-containing protein [Chitinophagales bacterium]MBP9549273.1 carboxypeptidase-like regulatory domain-containing protein [Chitinophagales bacterium]MBP9704902.1 carboxypeptidase-like regulatory domain-containing protein [Chitinophagales bacterium]
MKGDMIYLYLIVYNTYFPKNGILWENGKQNMRTHLFRYLLIIVVFLITISEAQAQRRLTQLSGVIIDKEYQYPLPYATVEIMNSYRGAASNSQGFFSLVVAVGDTLRFSSVGYKPRIFIVPDTITDIITSIGVLLDRDTVFLNTVEIYPWPKREDFKDAFLAMRMAEPQFTMGLIPGIKTHVDTTQMAPTIFNPISLFYESVIVPIEYNRKKKNKAKELPKWE